MKNILVYYLEYIIKAISRVFEYNFKVIVSGFTLGRNENKIEIIVKKHDKCIIRYKI